VGTRDRPITPVATGIAQSANIPNKLSSTRPKTRYFHLVFTIPAQLHKLFYINQKACYGLLFAGAAEALKKVAANPRFLGAETGAVAVLHTWGQSLAYHPHIHMIVPAGGLSSDQTEWIKAGKKFFLPVKALSKIFRAILCRMLEKNIDDSSIRLPDGINSFARLRKKLYKKNWNVYAKKAFGGPNSVVSYLGNYTHRVAITNNRIVKLENGTVTFRWKDYRNQLKNKYMQLNSGEFISRFLQHVLPNRFYKIRYFGLLAAINNGSKMEVALQLIGRDQYFSTLEGLNGIEVLEALTGVDLSFCPVCKKGRMKNKKLLWKQKPT
jgi:hypothetical protein